MPDGIISESGTLEGMEPDDLIPEAPTLAFEFTAPIWEDRIPGDEDDPFVGISFSGVLWTNDDRETSSSFAFITACRPGPSKSNPLAHYHTGYGIALRPSENGDVHNVYVIDNALAVPSVVLENVVHTGWGDMAYLASTHVDIEPNTYYNFRLDFDDGYTLKFWIWSVGSGAMPAVPQLTYGSYQPSSRGYYFAVSHSDTGGYRWQWDNIYLAYTVDKYAVQYYNFDAEGFVDQFDLKAYAYGYGYDGVSPLPEYGILMFIWNYTTETWDEVDSHTNGPGGAYTDIFMEGNELSVINYVGDLSPLIKSGTATDRVRVLLCSKYPSSISASVDSGVVVDYPYLENWNARSAHVGGMGDTYVNDGGQPIRISIDINNITSQEWLLASNASISGDLTLPAMWIETVELLDAAGNPTGFFAQPITDYELIIYAEDYRFSAKEQNYILFKNLLGSDVRVMYWTYPVVAQIQDYIDAELHRNVTDDYLAKLFGVAELFMDLTFSGSMSVIDMRDLLSKWINGSTRSSLTDLEIATYLQAQTTINDVTVNDLSAIKRLPSGNTEVISGTTLTLDERQAFVLAPNARHIIATAV